MIFGPVLPVELVTTSRRVRYFLVRVLYAAVLLVTLWVHYETYGHYRAVRQSPQQMAQLATLFFDSFSIVQLLAVMVLTPAMVAGTIADEKERRTLEHLLVTDLRDREIVLGKLCARLLHLVAQMAVGLPVLGLTMLLGGVSLERLAAVFVVTLATLVTIAMLSIWVSAQARRGRDAVISVFLIGLVLLLLPWLANIFAPRGGYKLPDFLESAVHFLVAGNPLACLVDQATGAGAANWPVVAELVRDQAMLAVPCGVLAVWQLRKTYVRQTYGKPQSPRGASGRWRLRLWAPTLGDSPMVWKELVVERPAGGHGVLGQAAQAVLCLAVLIPTFWIFTQVAEGNRWGWDPEGFRHYLTIVGTIVACIGLLLVALRSASSISSERERQTWEVLLSTPLTPSEIVAGKLWGTLYAVRGLVLLLVILWGLGIVAGSVAPLVVPAVAIELVVFGAFAALVGLAFSLRLKSSLAAMSAAAGTLAFLGGGYLFCCIPAMTNAGDNGVFLFAGCIPLLIGFPVALEPGRAEPLDSQEINLVGSCLLGLLLYFLAALFLWIDAVNSFDQHAGRVFRNGRKSGRSGGSQHPD